MIIIAALIGFFVWLELIRLNSNFQKEWNGEPAQVELQESHDHTYERGRRVIEVLTVVAVGICFVTAGPIVALLALLPIFLGAAACDAAWIRWCLRRPLSLNAPARSRKSAKASREVRYTT